MTARDGETRFGRVISFDEAVGLGEVEESGSLRRRYGFHCTQIADETRRIEVGSEVRFAVVASRRGDWEASGICPR